MLLANLKELRDDMRSKGWIISPFYATIRGQEYIVLAKRFTPNVVKKDFAILILEFFKNDGSFEELIVQANRVTFIGNVKTIREYFGIPYGDDIKFIMESLYEDFGSQIPQVAIEYKCDIDKKLMVQSLSISDSESPDKIYCTSVKRNPIIKGHQFYRSDYNLDKTRLLRKRLYKRFIDDPTISFNYREDKSKENTYETIIKRYTDRYSG